VKENRESRNNPTLFHLPRKTALSLAPESGGKNSMAFDLFSTPILRAAAGIRQSFEHRLEIIALRRDH
jgi:hypothetical protein